MVPIGVSLDSVAILLRDFLSLLFGLVGVVSFAVEIGKHDKKDDGVGTDPYDKKLGVVTVLQP